MGDITNLDNVRITLTANNDGVKTTLVYENGQNIVLGEKDFKIKRFEFGTNAPGQALVKFEINQTIDLSLTLKSNIKIEAVNPSTGKVISSKNKTWSGYLNDESGNKYGLGSILKPGVYTTVFNAEQL